METEILDDNTTQKIRNIEYASFLDRFLAAIMDSIIKMVALGYFSYMLYTEKNVMFFIIGAVIGMLYQPIMEGIWGATLGKMIMKITMVDTDYAQIDLGQSIQKNGIWIIYGILGIMSQYWVSGTEAFQEAEGFMEIAQAGQGNPWGFVVIVWIIVILVSVFMMLGSEFKQTLHDRLANTYCVKNSSFED